jgi:hypothetical protein
MDTVAELWETVTGPMREAEELLRAQREMLTVADQQSEAYRQVVRNLAKLCDEHNVPALKVAAALCPLFAVGPVPTQPQGPGHTEPMETDDVTRYHDAPEDHPFGSKTQELPTLVAQGLEVES